MKKYLLFILVVLGIYACSKDEYSTQAISETETHLRSDENKTGVRNNGRWLVFDSEKTYTNTQKTLETAIENYDYDRSGFKETDATYDYEPVLQVWESDLRHKSLRTKNLKEEHEKLVSGMHPRDVLNSIQDYGILDDIELAQLSEEGVVQIGNKIFLYKRDRRIISSNPAIIENILDEGDLVIFDPSVITQVEVEHFAAGSGGGGEAPECDATFGQFGDASQNMDNTYNVTMVWGNALEVACLENLSLTWNWDDNTDDTVDATGTVNHTYAEAGTYNICLDVVWLHEADDPADNVECETTWCDMITIEEETPFCTEEKLCDVILALASIPPVGIPGIGNITDLLVDLDNSGPNLLCADVPALLAFGSSVCADIEPTDIDITFRGEPGPCWEICDGNRNLVLSVGNACEVTVNVEHNQNINCDPGQTNDRWQWLEWNGGNTGCSYKQKTRNNAKQLKSKMVRYEDTRNGGNRWRKRRAYIGLRNHGIVYGTQGCGCDRQEDINNETFTSLRRYHKTLREDVLGNVSKLNYNNTEPCWSTDYFSDEGNVNNATYRGTGTPCD